MQLPITRKERWTRLEAKAKRWETRNRTGILCSPPSSGKNTLGEYFRDYHNDIYIILAGMICEGEETKRNEFDAFWMCKKVKIFSQILDVMILFLGMYHPTLVDNPTPAEFAHALGLNDTLVMNFVQKCNMQSLRSSIATTSRAVHWTENWNPSKGETKCLCKDSTNGKIKFSAPITRIILSHHLYTSSLAKSPKINFRDFLVRTIERLPSKLINSLGKGIDSYLFKRGWQMEWYRTATTVVPIDATVNADCGHSVWLIRISRFLH
ncbi:uncharacterized protein OCT59_020368 [Rhizophagus irregularis]|uniref:Uncharacterized protein n=1 Tax=Rhizophagus irregularis TaxID=588596 RepID=A0A916EF06_9GLOM|nr:hypothetical protein OCT59_020368 [Rhizophagus irregularis]CAB5182416.1 unnamed protein product [Rhizophagus irregularis]CAB5386093.1 unnamed protein product [Rhizophagus irregularis]